MEIKFLTLVYISHSFCEFYLIKGRNITCDYFERYALMSSRNAVIATTCCSSQAKRQHTHILHCSLYMCGARTHIREAKSHAKG